MFQLELREFFAKKFQVREIGKIYYCSQFQLQKPNLHIICL